MRADGRDFDVFLSHNSDDKDDVEFLAKRLVDEASLKPFLDKWHLVPGNPWQEALEVALDRSRTCVVFIGRKGLGPWHNEEMRSALDERVTQQGFRVVPVLLPGAILPTRGQLPRFLRRLTWVDFRGQKGVHDSEAFRRLVAGIRGIAPGRNDQSASTAPVHECPYRGLEVFDAAHQHLFFGREADTQHLIEAVRGTRFVAVVGSSGNGKSSLVRAGLLPALRANALPHSQEWWYSILKPGTHPLEELAVELAQITRRDEISPLLKALEQDERELHLQVRLSLRNRPETARVCLVIDQFEELFTLCRDRTERERFINSLRYAATVVGGQAVVVLTMRADFIAQATEYSSLAELLSGHQFLVSPMESEDLRRAIEKPALMTGARFEDGLVEQILQDTGREPGALPLLEHALLQTWEHRQADNLLTFAAYRTIGGVQGALAKHADSVYDNLSATEQDITRRLLLRLTQVGEGTEDTRRRATREELQTGEEEQQALESVNKQLTDARLLVTSGDQHTDTVDVAHEALIRGWPRLRKWIDESREALRLYRRIAEATREWVRLQHDEGALYRGSLLTKAQEWRQQHDKELNQREKGFLDASVLLAEREKEKHEEYERRIRELEDVERFHQEQSRQKSQFLASVSHELRTPLNAIYGFTTLVQRKSGHLLPERQQQNLQKVSESAAHLLTFFNRHVDLSKMRPVQAYRLIMECCETVSPHLKSGVLLRHELLPESEEAYIDADGLRLIVRNLLSNAVKFTDVGEIVVRAEMNRDVKRDKLLKIAVSDTGRGIPREDLDNIFDEFHQMAGVEDERGGIELFLARRWTELLGGSIRVESELGKGSTFTVTIPAVYREPRQS